jgi:hypothetical protein
MWWYIGRLTDEYTGLTEERTGFHAGALILSLCAQQWLKLLRIDASHHAVLNKEIFMHTIICISMGTESWLEISISYRLIYDRQQDQIMGIIYMGGRQICN